MLIEGSLTHTSEDGKTTLYGIPQSAGTGGRWKRCQTASLMIRVSAPGTLQWIQEKINIYQSI